MLKIILAQLTQHSNKKALIKKGLLNKDLNHFNQASPELGKWSLALNLGGLILLWHILNNHNVRFAQWKFIIHIFKVNYFSVSFINCW
ncbi:hypothetical protein BMR02_08530 [Methylococcaceae bacterium HT1]|nr:hypothetical protein BMR02_08530 [Methylococcaceae bacterium HT1]TXL16210.1 hypothetical protein BMR04_10460 [Methylococcaceae bacterium HT3]TXL23649.1 hypothetical protein BMR03_01475 [Methylococcaceae bacterium HT2]